jgi:hypothetical protein
MTSRDDGSHTIFGLKTMVVIAAVAIIGIAVGMSMAGGEGDAPAPFAVTGNDELPAWCGGAFYLGGECLTEPVAWHVPASEPAGVGDLFVSLNGQTLDELLVIAVTLEDTVGSSLYLDLLDTDMEDVEVNVFSNLVEGAGEKATVELLLPLNEYPDASIIRLWRGTGDITVYEVAVGVPDGIWVTICGGSYVTNRRWVSDALYRDAAAAGSSAIEPTQATETADVAPDTTLLVGTNGTNVVVVPTQPGQDVGPANIIYVHAKTGSDSFTGRRETPSGDEGPKKTIRGGIQAARPDDIVVLKDGHCAGHRMLRP